MKKLIALMLALLAAWPACALAEKENADLFARRCLKTAMCRKGILSIWTPSRLPARAS